MIGLTPPDRWTCPTCGRTVAPRVSGDEALRLAIRAAQETHARRHKSAFEVALRQVAGEPNASSTA